MQWFERGRMRPTIVIGVVPVLIAVIAAGSIAAFGLDMAKPTAADKPGTTGDSDRPSAATTPQTTAEARPKAATGSSHGASGDPTMPQPLSGADQNEGGANGQCPDGPYCSTRDGSPSLNGNGLGTPTAKPCAGCVGKADNKNPKGQLPGPSDINRGYECDANSGIGKSNPAHTLCTEPTPSPAAPAPTPAPTTSPTAASVAPSSPEPSPGPQSPPVDVTTSTALSTTVLPPLPVAAPHPPTLAHSVLPNTGAPARLWLLTAVGLGSVAGGLMLVLIHRRRTVG